MYLKTHHTESVRQELELEFPFLHLAVEQEFPSHPTMGIRYRVYRTDCDRPEFYTYDASAIRAAIVNREI